LREAAEEVDREHYKEDLSKDDAACHKLRGSGRTGHRGKYSSSPIVKPLEERRTGLKTEKRKNFCTIALNVDLIQARPSTKTTSFVDIAINLPWRNFLSTEFGTKS